MKKLTWSMAVIFSMLMAAAMPTAEAIEIEGHYLHAFNFRDNDLKNTSGWGGGTDLSSCRGY